MDPNEISTRRDQMGQAAGAMLRGGPAPIVDRGEGYWIALSGAPSPDMNMTLVSSGGAAAVAGVLHRVTESGIPTLFMLAGECQAEVLDEPWEQVGEMPFMASALTSEHLVSDSRVRRVGPDDADVVCQVMAEAFGLGQDLLVDVIAGVLGGGGGKTSVWLLDNDGVPVSAVLTSMVNDAVTVWCMSTPERFGRRGFGRAVLAHALLEAKSEGATVGLLGATPAGKPLYDRTGWITLETWPMFASAESAQFPA
jgi:GNAT superfamily N-acetyltransferase